MNTRNRITLLLAAIMVVALLVVGMTLTASAADGDLVTEYGTVPAANANDNFVVFQKAPGASEYTFVGSAANAFTASFDGKAYHTLPGDVVVLMLKDFAVPSNYPFHNAMASTNFVLDLGGKTLTAPNHATGAFSFQTRPTATDTVHNITIKNGTVTGLQSSFITGYNDQAHTASSVVFNFTLDHVRFIRTAGTTYTQPVFQVNKSGVASTLNVTYNECEFDMRGMTADQLIFVINSTRTDSTQTVVSTVKGGKIILDYTKEVNVVRGNNATFVKGENGYTKVLTPKGTELTGFGSPAYDDANAKFVKSYEDANFAYHEVVSRDTKYGQLVSGAESPWAFPIIIFGKATGSDTWTFIRACDLAGNDPFVAANVARYKDFDGEVVIWLRRDVDFSARGTCKDLYNVNPKLTIDLDGHSLRSTDAAGTGLFALDPAVTTSPTTPDVTFKNGTIITKTQTFLVIYNNNDAATETYKADVKFDNITFDRAEGATKEQPFVQINRVLKTAQTVNITYNDCTFDVRGAFGTPTLYLFTVCNASDSKINVSVAINGGKILTDTTNGLQLFLFGGKNGSTLHINPGSDGKHLGLVLPSGVANTMHNGSSTAGSNIYQNPTDNIAYSFGKSYTDGVNDTYQFAPYWMNHAEATPKTSVTLTTDLVYNIYIPIARVTAAKINGVVINLPILPKVTLDNGLTYWHYTVEAGLLGAGDEIELITTVNTGGTTRMDATRKINVLKYAKTVLANNPTETNATLVKDMLAYVKAACVYANDKAETVAAINAIIGEDYAVEPAVGEVVESTEGLASVQLLLGDKPAFVFTPNGEYDINAYKFTADGTSLKTEIAEIDDKQVIIVYAYAYAMTYTVNYTIEGTEISGAYNLAAYLAHEKAAGHANTVALVEALWQYSVAAKAYKVENA